MLRLLTTIFLISAGIFLYSYFRELNPGHHHRPHRPVNAI